MIYCDLFSSDRMKGLMNTMGIKDGEPIEHKMLNNSLERAQKQVEGRNFDIRKHLLDYDDVMNQQRKYYYAKRDEILDTGPRQWFFDTIDFYLNDFDTHFLQLDKGSDWDGYRSRFNEVFFTDINNDAELKTSLEFELPKERIAALKEILESRYMNKMSVIEDEEILEINERLVVLQIIDQLWKDHLLQMDHLRDYIGLRAHAQKDPLLEYKAESYDLFQDFLARMEEDVVKLLCRVQPQGAPVDAPKQQDMQYGDGQPKEQGQKQQPARRSDKKLKRNEPCWCESGKKFKHCHGA